MRFCDAHAAAGKHERTAAQMLRQPLAILQQPFRTSIGSVQYTVAQATDAISGEFSTSDLQL